MAQTDLRRKQTSGWPWLVGAAILALVVYGVTSLLAAPNAEPDVEAEAVVDQGPDPAALPAPPNPISISPRVRSVAELAPLDLDDVGEAVRAEGEVLATGTDGFWILVGSEVLRVDSDRTVRKGQLVTVEGTLMESDGERTERIAAEVLSRSAQAEEWRVVRNMKVVEPPGSTDLEDATDAAAVGMPVSTGDAW